MTETSVEEQSTVVTNAPANVEVDTSVRNFSIAACQSSLLT